MGANSVACKDTTSSDGVLQSLIVPAEEDRKE